MRACASWGVVLACVAVQQAAAQNTGRPTRPPGWEYRAALGVQPPSFAYNPCPGCYSEDLSTLIISCPRGERPRLMVVPPDNNGVMTRMAGRLAEVALEVDGKRVPLRAPVEDGPNGVVMEMPLDARSPLIGALATARSLRIVSPAGGGAVTLPTRGAADVINRWSRACGLSPAAAPAPASDQALRRRIAAYLDGEFPGIQPSEYKLALRDLNGDGVPEALIDILPSAFCGAANCPGLILDLSGPSARAVHQGLVGDFRPLNSRTGGWADVAVFGGGVLRWRGNGYVLGRR